MNAPDLLALSLGLSVATAGMAWIGGRLVEVRTADPRLRDRMWAAALALPALPPLAVGLLLLTPAPVREIAVATPLAAAPTLLEASALSATAPMAPAFDPDLIAPAILAAAAIAAVWRLGRLGLGAWRLGRLLGGLGEADAGTVAMVHEVAGRLSLGPPRVGVSPGATEPLLAGFTTPRLILPAGLATAGDRAVARAMIAHELVHLKRNDHRIIWLEEALLALLAANPLMPALRARRAAAREEACDVQALDGAGAETRRAYAQSLIEALRSRAGPQALPALTFTGAGRKSAMHRLKAVMTPAAPAGRRTRLISAAAVAAIAAAAGAGSLAVAGEREATVRLHAPAPATRAVRAEAPQVRAAPPAGERDPVENSARLTPAQQARFRDPTGAEYRAICASDEPADGGFCAGVMFSFLHDAPANGVCAPEAVLDGGGDPATLGAYVEGGKTQVARLTPRRGEGAVSFAGRALQAAYPCEAGPAGATADLNPALGSRPG